MFHIIFFTHQLVLNGAREMVAARERGRWDLAQYFHMPLRCRVFLILYKIQEVTKTIENRIDHESRPTVSTFVWRSCQVIFLVSKLSPWRFGESQQAHTRSRFTREVDFQRSLRVCFERAGAAISTSQDHLALIIQPLRRAPSQVKSSLRLAITADIFLNRTSSNPPQQAT